MESEQGGQYQIEKDSGLPDGHDDNPAQKYKGRLDGLGDILDGVEGLIEAKKPVADTFRQSGGQ